MTEIQIIEKIFEGVTEVVAAAEFPVEPYGRAWFAAEDTSDESRKILQDLALHWSELWRVIRQKLVHEIDNYGTEQDLTTQPFVVDVMSLEEGIYMADQADILVRFDFGDVPLWDAYTRNTDVVHFQAVF